MSMKPATAAYFGGTTCAPEFAAAGFCSTSFGFISSKNACRASSPSGARLVERHEHALLLA